MNNDRVLMSFSGKTHSGNVALRDDGRTVLTVWKNHTLHGDGDEQTVVIRRDLLQNVINALTVARDAHELERAE